MPGARGRSGAPPGDGAVPAAARPAVARGGRTQRGRRGEQLAVSELLRLGFRILATNLRLSRAEIDILAMEKRTLCIVEVRMRTQDRFGSAEESVDPRKQRRLAGAARELLGRAGLPAHDSVRFDVVAIDARGEPPRIHLLRSAFYTNR